eukprot:tig00020563_g11283.t1
MTSTDEPAAAVSGSSGDDADPFAWHTPLTKLPPIVHPVVDEATLPGWPQPVVFVDFREAAAGPSTFRLITESAKRSRRSEARAPSSSVRPGAGGRICIWNYAEERPLRVQCTGDLAIVADGFGVTLLPSKKAEPLQTHAYAKVLDIEHVNVNCSASNPHSLLIHGLDVRGTIQLSRSPAAEIITECDWRRQGRPCSQKNPCICVEFRKRLYTECTRDPDALWRALDSVPVRAGPFSSLEPEERAALVRRQAERRVRAPAPRSADLASLEIARDIRTLREKVAELVESQSATNSNLGRILEATGAKAAMEEEKVSKLAAENEVHSPSPLTRLLTLFLELAF